ncbi:MAG: hypothetical protein Tsb0034_23550 [Ekhidna sp.]
MLSAGFTNIQAQNSLLEGADSLFMDQKYTQAYSIYDSIFEEGLASPGMLLKMAFIQDASGSYERALYFLDLYYQQTADRSSIEKIEEIAEEYGLSGYAYDDADFFLALLNKHKSKFMLAIAAILIALVVYIYKKWSANERPLAAFFIQLFFATCLIMVVNLRPAQKAIITSNNTLLRDGPSAGAEPVLFVDKGHKVTVLKRSDLWAKIVWEGEEYYVRNNKLRTI